MTPATGDEGVGLDEAEIQALARYIIADKIDDADDWLLWEDYPNLGEHTFEALVAAVSEHGKWQHRLVAMWEQAYDVDVRHILEEAQR